MCGGGNKGPSAAETVQVENAAKARADAEIARINAEREAEKEAANTKVVAEQAALANQDAARRVRNRTLLAGLDKEEDPLEAPDPLAALDPLAVKPKKARKATLLSGL
ncbi:MAG: hypothetical protein Q7T13_01605 [Polaromonas sp.]|nr:hypothetical protein [Polaromonas sp.]